MNNQTDTQDDCDARFMQWIDDHPKTFRVVLFAFLFSLGAIAIWFN